MRSPFVTRSATLVLAACLAAPALAQRPTDTTTHVASQRDSGTTATARKPGTAPLDRRITLKLGTVGLERALEEIASRAGLTLGYSADVLPRGHQVEVRVSGVTARDALASVLRDTGLEVRELPGGQALLVRRPPEPETRTDTPAQVATIAGRVTAAETGAGLSGARVRLEGTQSGTLTGTDGRYRLQNVPPGSHRIIASMIGYAEGGRSVTVRADETATVDLALEVSAVPLDQVVVTGTVVPTEVRAIPTPVTVVTSADIDRLKVRRVDQLFRGLIPGVIAPEPGAVDWSSEVHVRGKSTMGSPSVKTYIDGVEVTDHRFIATIDPNTIERVELIRGPQASTIYGPEAINGVLQIITKKGALGSAPELSASVAVGGVESDYVNARTLRTDNSLGIAGGGQNYSYNLVGSYQTIGEWVPAYSSRSPNLAGGIRLTQGALALEFSSRFTRKAFNSPWNPILRDAGYAPWSTPPNQRNELQQQTHALRLNYSVLPRWEHQLTIGQDVSATAMYQTAPRFQTAADTLLTVQASKGGRTTVAYNNSLRLDWHGVSAGLTTGFDYSLYDLSSFSQIRATRTEGFLDGTTALAARTISSSSGLFSQLQVGLSDVFHVTAGVRRDVSTNFGENLGAAVSPRIGASLVQQIGSVTAKARMAYGEAIRPPDLGHSQGVSTATVRVLPNPEISPERQRGWDAGIDVFIGQNISLGLTRYDQVAGDLIETVLLDASSQPLIYQSQNVGEIHNRGWEIEAEAQLGPLSIGGSYSAMRSTVAQLSPSYSGTQVVGEQLFGVPERVIGVQAALAVGLRTDLNANLTHSRGWRDMDWLSYYGWRYGGETYRGSLRDYMVGYPGVTKINVGAHHQITPRLTAYVQIDNLTNNLRTESDNLTQVMGRTAWVGLRVVRRATSQ